MQSLSQLLSQEDLTTLIETGQELAAEVSYQVLLQNILNRVCQLTDSPEACVILFNEKRNNLYFAQAIGPEAAKVLEKWGETSKQGIPLEGSKAGQVFLSGQPIIDKKLTDDEAHFKGVDQDTKISTVSMVCVPLSVSGKNIGVMQILNKRQGSYSQRDLVLLELFASQSAIAIRNARLFNDLLAHMGIYASLDERRSPTELFKELNRPAQNELLTVLFVDMRGFTKLCEVLNRPELAQKRLNEFLAFLANEVIQAGGIVNKFLGDGLMALFRQNDHAERAVNCAFAMQTGFQQLRDKWDEESNAPLSFIDLGIGIATDTVIIGTLGSERIRDFTAVGIAVNLASRLMENARNGRQILVDKRTFRKVKDKIDKFEGPATFALNKDERLGGNTYEYYHLKSLKQKNAVAPSAAIPAQLSAKPSPTQESNIFISYSHKDVRWLDLLKTHLQPYLRIGKLKVWDDKDIKSGDIWRDEITHALDTAQVAVLLVSHNFLASEFIVTNELPPLLNAAKDKGVKILWVPISACSYDETEIEKYQAALDPARPLDSLKEAELNQTLVKLCKEIKDAIKT